MEWDSLGRWFRNLLTVSAVALVLHEHIPKNAECFGTTYLMFLARKWMRIVKQTIMRVQVIIGMPSLGSFRVLIVVVATLVVLIHSYFRSREIL